MKPLLNVVAAAEAATGLVLIAYPSIVARLLFGGDVDGAGDAMSRIAGLGLVGLGVACWPGRPESAVTGMLTYSAGATLYLLFLGVNGQWAGPLLWPAVVAHALITVLLAAAWTRAPSMAASTIVR